MPTREEMLELVNDHAALDDPMETAIWIRCTDREAWLVELLPTLPGGEHPERPIAFNPGLTFRHPLNLIASDLEGLKRAIRTRPDLARDIAAGEILHGEEAGRELQTFAREHHGDVRAG